MDMISGLRYAAAQKKAEEEAAAAAAAAKAKAESAEDADEPGTAPVDEASTPNA